MKLSELNKKIDPTLHILEDCARKGKTINYESLYRQLGLDTENPDDRSSGAHLLAEANLVSLKKNDCMISSIVLLKASNAPAEGFYEFAIEINRLDQDEEDYEAFWVSEVDKVFKAYKE